MTERTTKKVSISHVRQKEEKVEKKEGIDEKKVENVAEKEVTETEESDSSENSKE